MVAYKTGIGKIDGLVGDVGYYGAVLVGDGRSDPTTASYGWQIVNSQPGLVPWGIWIDGMSDVLITGNSFGYNKTDSILVYSPQGYSTYRLNVTGNSFTSNPAHPTGTYIDLESPCMGCSITGNTFAYSSLQDILLASGASGTSNLIVSHNNSLKMQRLFLNATTMTSGSWIGDGNIIDTPGYYGVFSGNMNARLDNNVCANPFAVSAPLSGNAYQSACFLFTGSSATTVEASNNSVTSSGGTKYPAVNLYAAFAPISGSTSGNRSDYSGCAVCNYSSGTGLVTSLNEVASNYGSSGSALFGPVVAQQVNVAGDLSARDIPGHEYFVSKYASIQAAINAAYNNGAVLGAVVDDRTAPYSGPGFILYDSVTLKLAATTYTISSAVTYNNGNNNVTAGIVLVPGAHLVGAGTSSNHGTILQPGNGLNADLIATSTVGTGTGASVQWWHWGEVGNLRIIGNGANQTAGECLKIENMGETAKVHDVELSACYSNNVEIIGASATQSAISNVTSNLSAGGAGVAFTNLGGVGVLGGISGDCNHTALIAANFGASGTLEINGLKAEAESSICPSQVQDPVILSTTTDATVLASIKVDGGYAFGSTQHDFVKSTGPGSIQYLQNNFYLTGYTNILNDTVRSQVLPNLATTVKQPVSYLSNGTIFANQAFWFQPNTFIQGNPNGTPTELFGLTSSGGAMLAAPGNGDNANAGTGGVQIASFNRSIFGQTPEPMARWGWRFLGSGGGYDTTKWDLVPVWAAGDASDRSIGNASANCQNGNGSVSCRWPHVYAANVDTTSLTVNGTPVVPGAHLVSGTMQGQTAQITGTGSYATLYSATIPAGTAAVGAGIKCRAYFRHTTGGGTVAMQWKLGSTSQAYATTFTGGNTGAVADIEIFTPSSTNAEIVNIPYTYFGGTLNGPATGLAWSENLTNANTISLQFNVAATDKLTGDTFYCQTVQ